LERAKQAKAGASSFFFFFRGAAAALAAFLRDTKRQSNQSIKKRPGVPKERVRAVGLFYRRTES
jgi:hypothetical protein